MNATASERTISNAVLAKPWIGAALAASATAAFLVATPAHAYTVFWPNQTFEYADPAPPPPKRVRKPKYPGLAAAPKDLAKPNGPLIIVVSIDRQTLRIYDANGLFAETPVSTGMRGHSTPMGVFSVIQKSKWHRSNLYSSAPMPYMQRITWSGVALHAGVLPGYPASHGCIRMPMAFATKLWNWSRLGARVIVAPGELSPTDISHPALLAHAEQVAAKSSPAAPAPALDAAELRLTPHDGPGGSAPDGATARVRVADAEGGFAAPAAREDAGSRSGDQDKETSAAPAGEAKDAAAKQSNADAPAGSQPRAAEGLEAPAATQATANAKSNAAVKVDGKPDAAAPAKVRGEAAPAAAAASPAPAAEAPPAAKPEVAQPRRGGHVAVLISRKDGRLYVRQNFEPWFDVPITIAAGDRPLGTHIFTARRDSGDAGSYRWSVVSLPALARHIEITDRRGRRALQDEAAPAPVQATPAEALDRLAIPEEARLKIASALTSGTSIIVSDLGPGSETGLGTDFIMPLR